MSATLQYAAKTTVPSAPASGASSVTQDTNSFSRSADPSAETASKEGQKSAMTETPPTTTAAAVSANHKATMSAAESRRSAK